MTDFNPYQAPKADLITHDDKNNGIRRYGKNVLFVPHTTELPARCVKCNAPSVTKKTMRFYQNSFYPLFTVIIGGSILYLIGLLQQLFVVLIFGTLLTALFTRKIRKLNFGLCQSCHAKRIKFAIIWLIACIVCIALALSLLEYSEFAVLFMILGLPLNIYGLSKSLHLARMSKMDSFGIYLKDLDKSFLHSFDF